MTNRLFTLKRRSNFTTINLTKMGITCLLLLACTLGLSAQSQNKEAKPDAAEDPQWKAVEETLGRPGQVQPDGVLKFGMPRRDLKVSVAGVEVKPGFALGSWAAFKKSGSDAMVMGDLVLVENEVAPVMAKLQAEGLEITALHNHLLGETPRIMYMHIGGHGDAVKLAESLKDVLALTGTPPPAPSATSAPAAEIGIDTKKLGEIIGRAGKVNGGILQFAVPRAEHITQGDMIIPNSMGISTAINFQPTGDGRAAITGDFVLLGKEVNPVIKALRENGIAVTAVHNHMLMEEPRLFFMHFWANDDALKLAKGLRAALDQTNSAKP
ncbi:MAG TPA: DUF1259 domain-containing protein [Terriglobales bacterium]|jgi:hypothetical protein|nr:DUF1259 domain-containing protein [Terriglobales bacterium]